MLIKGIVIQNSIVYHVILSILPAPQRNAQGEIYIINKEPTAPVHITIPHSSGFSD